MSDSYINSQDGQSQEVGILPLTLSDYTPPETDKTDETYSPDNWEFLGQVFGTETSDACPIVVSFAGNPQNVAQKSWYGKPWKPDAPDISAVHNNYFSLAVFGPDETGRYRRQKKQFVALYAVMLDDIGTKIPADRITLSPSWRIETSPDNFQLGYILAEPVTGVSSDGESNAMPGALFLACVSCAPAAAGRLRLGM